jgi:hypothetical protein
MARRLDLPFEGTGAVSTWRIRIAGRAPELSDVRDVVVTVRYSADDGGEVFAAAVKGMLKPYAAARFFDIAAEFPQEWAEFHEGDGSELVLPFTADIFPGMASRQVTGAGLGFPARGRQGGLAGGRIGSHLQGGGAVTMTRSTEHKRTKGRSPTKKQTEKTLTKTKRTGPKVAAPAEQRPATAAEIKLHDQVSAEARKAAKSGFAARFATAMEKFSKGVTIGIDKNLEVDVIQNASVKVAKASGHGHETDAVPVADGLDDARPRMPTSGRP